MSTTTSTVSTRSVFLVGAKLLGIYALYQIAINLMSLVGFTAQLIASGGASNLSGVIFSVSGSLFAAFFFWLLAVRTERLADWVGLADDSAEMTASTVDAIRVGAILVGLFVVLQSVRYAVVPLSFIVSGQARMGGGGFFRDAVAALIPIGLGLAVMWKARWLAERLDRGGEVEEVEEAW